MPSEPRKPADARKLIRAIIDNGSVSYSRHAQEKMKERQLTTVDVVNVLHGGWVKPAELESGTYRYTVCTAKIEVVVAFRSDTELRVVTTWRVKP